jgi:hypothetical protein
MVPKGKIQITNPKSQANTKHQITNFKSQAAPIFQIRKKRQIFGIYLELDLWNLFVI